VVSILSQKRHKNRIQIRVKAKLAEDEARKQKREKKLEQKPTIPQAEEKLSGKTMAQAERESHIGETDKLDSKNPKEANKAHEKVSGKTEEPKKAKPVKAAFPHETAINAYGFLQFGKEIMETLGVSKTEKNESGKAVYPITKVSITSFNAETREITIKVT
jgi:hypothetical protein